MKYPPTFFNSYFEDCPNCKINFFDSIMDTSLGEGRKCEKCELKYNAFKEFWNDFTNSEDDIGEIARNKSAKQLLRRIFVAYSYKGIHKPLILPGSLKIEVTKRCNLSCKHCLANSDSTKYPELSYQEILALLTQAKEIGVTSVGFVGGEPLIRKDLPKIAKFSESISVKYSISSNGMLLTPDIISSIKSQFLSKVSISLDGTKEYHNYLRENSNAFDFALRGISLLRTENIPVAVAMMINKDNKNYIQDVIENAIHVGANFFIINDLIPTGRGEDMINSCLSYQEYLDVTETMLGFRKDYGKKINILWKGMDPGSPDDKNLGYFFNSKCGAALSELTIDNEGFIQPCPFLPKTSENIRMRSLKDIWYCSEELNTYQNRDSLTGGCGSCHKQYSCSGCRARALAHTGSINGPDIRCPNCQN